MRHTGANKSISSDPRTATEVVAQSTPVKSESMLTMQDDPCGCQSQSSHA
jgi:hypothetical protein